MTDTLEKSRIDMPSDTFAAERYDKLQEAVYGNPVRQGRTGKPQRTSQAHAVSHDYTGLSRTISRAFWSGLRSRHRRMAQRSCNRSFLIAANYEDLFRLKYALNSKLQLTRELQIG